jgi:hypothetical protein
MNAFAAHGTGMLMAMVLATRAIPKGAPKTAGYVGNNGDCNDNDKTGLPANLLSRRGWRQPGRCRYFNQHL